jgi:hypothetical protein
MPHKHNTTRGRANDDLVDESWEPGPGAAKAINPRLAAVNLGSRRLPSIPMATLCLLLGRGYVHISKA